MIVEAPGSRSFLRLKIMSTVSIEPLLHQSVRETVRCGPKYKAFKLCSLNCSPNHKLNFSARSFCNFRPPKAYALRASAATETALVETVESTDVFFRETFPIERTETVEGKIFIRLDQGRNNGNWKLTVGCNVLGKWILHWGVSYVDDVGSEWDQPPKEMRPQGSIPIKDYAIETPLKKSSSEGDMFYEVTIDLIPKSGIAAINFVLKEEETGAWYQHRGRDFKVPVVDYLQDDGNMVGAKRSFRIWPGDLGPLSNLLPKAEPSQTNDADSRTESGDSKQESRSLEGFYVEQLIAKQLCLDYSLSVSVRKCPETAKNLVYVETDLPGDVVIHWGVCRDHAQKWEIPAAPHPPETITFKDKALRTQLQVRGKSTKLGGQSIIRHKVRDRMEST